MKVIGKYFILLFVFITFIPFLSYGNHISGLVTGRTGEALPFATIFIKETSYGTTTNLEGNYEFSVEPGKYTVIFQYLGYQTEYREITVGNEDIVIDVVLKEQSYVLPIIL